MPSLVITAAFVLLFVAGPILAFPDVLPVGWRVPVVTSATFAALGFGVWLVDPWKPLRWGLCLFGLAVAASWAQMPAHDLVGTRHFAGVGLGVLTMAVVARWCTTEDRLVTAALVFALASTAVLLIGFVGTSSSFNNIKFLRWNQMLSLRTMEKLDKMKLPLPGLEGDGKVNPNALGGTALLLMPACGGLMAAALVMTRRRLLTLIVASVATTVATGVLGVTLSRTAWVAALLTLVLLGLRWRRGRWWVAGALLVVVAGLTYGMAEWRAARPAHFDAAFRVSADDRVATWLDGLERLKQAPWLGIGINQFHESTRGGDGSGTHYVAHAHNTLLQVALDVGGLGLLGYVLIFGSLIVGANGTARQPGVVGRIAAGAGLSLTAVHLFGLADAITLGAKVGIFQWICAGLIAGASRWGSDWSMPAMSDGEKRAHADAGY